MSEQFTCPYEQDKCNQIHCCKEIASASEVACLLTQINREYEAARSGLSGLACGVSRHQFITRKMENIAEMHSQLRSLVGDEAMRQINELLDPQADLSPEDREAREKGLRLVARVEHRSQHDEEFQQSLQEGIDDIEAGRTITIEFHRVDLRQSGGPVA